MTDESDFFPDIFDYLSSLNNDKSVSIKNLEEIVYKICAYTGLSKEVAGEILKNYFQEIRSIILSGNLVVINDLGKFYLSTPKNFGNKKRIFPKFKAHKQLIKKINNDS